MATVATAMRSKSAIHRGTGERRQPRRFGGDLEAMSLLSAFGNLNRFMYVPRIHHWKAVHIAAHQLIDTREKSNTTNSGGNRRIIAMR